MDTANIQTWADIGVIFLLFAPKAAENPVCAAITTMPKQSPRETISKVSSLISFRHRFNNPGMR